MKCKSNNKWKTTDITCMQHIINLLTVNRNATDKSFVDEKHTELWA